MSATNREIEAFVVAHDVDDPKARRAALKEAKEIALASGQSLETVQSVLGHVRKARKRTVRAVDDFYETPAEAIDPILPFLPLGRGDFAIDAGSGTGAIAARLAAHSPGLPICGVEKSPGLVEQARARGIYTAEFVQGDFLKWSPDVAIRPTLVIMNPPYSRALPFVERAIDLAGRTGTVAALLRLGWAASRSRAAFHTRYRSDVYVLSKRPSFRRDGKTDAAEYAWFVWGPGRGGRWMVLEPSKSGRV